MKKLHVTLTFTEPVLGTSPNDEDIYRNFIGDKAPDAPSLEEEVAALGVDEVTETGMTVFPRNDEGSPILWDYQIKGFFKDACSMLARIGKSAAKAEEEKPAEEQPADKAEEGGKPKKVKKASAKKAVNESSKLTAYKKIIDGLIFVTPRKIPVQFDGKIGYCQRPLRAQTMQGERVTLAMSEEIPANAQIEFDVICLADEHIAAVKEWLDYGILRGIGQWRNSGKGRFTYTAEEVA